jgi:hypothetical protein
MEKAANDIYWIMNSIDGNELLLRIIEFPE